jgi:acyl carrier protein
MTKNEIRDAIIRQLDEKLRVFEIRPEEVIGRFDLVKSGLLDSMAFVDLVAGIENACSIEIDFEKATATDDFTKMTPLIELIFNTIHEG